MRTALRRRTRASAPIAIAAYVVYVTSDLCKLCLLCHDLRAFV